MNPLILHHYDASPFTQKALKMLAIKEAWWLSVETPMLPPKDDLVTLTGGYRGTPVLQVGADVFIDSQRIAVELDRLQPEPALMPPSIAGLGLMLVKWSDQFFRSALYRAISQTAAQWDPVFLDDRRYLFPDIDFDAASDEADHRGDQFRAHAALLEAQLADGRPFLGGQEPTLLDVQAWPFVWMSRGLTGTDELLDGFDALVAWERRVTDLGEGLREVIDAEWALSVARDAMPAAVPAATEHDATAPARGTIVEVSPDDTRRGAVAGDLVHADAREIVLAHENDRAGRIHVHFPRVGYRLEVAS